MAASTTAVAAASFSLLRRPLILATPLTLASPPLQLSSRVTLTTVVSPVLYAFSAARKEAAVRALAAAVEAPADVVESKGEVEDDESSSASSDVEDVDGDGDGDVDGDVDVDVGQGNSRANKRFELYACNLPRSCDIPQLLEIFAPFGAVIAVEVPRDAANGASKGCGYVTMGSAAEAKAAIDALDGSDLGGREMRVRFSSDMERSRTSLMNIRPKNTIFESPHKVYVGNLAWSVRPEDLREHFSQFGTVLSTRVLYDRKRGKTRVYGFLSFSSQEEVNAAVKLSGSVFRGRFLLVRQIVKTET